MIKKLISHSFKVGKIYININYIIVPIIVFAAFSNLLFQYLLTFLFITIHELCHIIAAILSGGKLYCIRILPIGLNAILEDSGCCKHQRLIIYSAGPFINILLSIIMAAAYVLGVNSEKTAACMTINILLALFNMMPALPLDGGKIAVELLEGHFGLFGSGKKLYFFSVVLSLITICIGLFQCTRSLNNFYLIFLGVYVLLYIRESKDEIAFMNIKSLLYRRSNIIKKGIYPVLELVCLKDIKLSEVIKAMDHKDRFHIINVLDDKMRIIGVVTEQKVLDTALEQGVDLTIDKLLTITEK